MSDTALVIIAKPPILGQVKSRLAVTIGEAGALDVYRQLLQTVVRVIRDWEGPVLLSAHALSPWEGSGLEHLPRQLQPSTGLGGRIAQALAWGLTCAPRALAIGTDCPGLSVPHLTTVANGLEAAPVAFGPAVDGGYWAIGVTRAAPLELLGAEQLPWSTPDLLASTTASLLARGCTWHLGTTLADCDDAVDLQLAVTSGLLTMPT